MSRESVERDAAANMSEGVTSGDDDIGSDATGAGRSASSADDSAAGVAGAASDSEGTTSGTGAEAAG